MPAVDNAVHNMLGKILRENAKRQAQLDRQHAVTGFMWSPLYTLMVLAFYWDAWSTLNGGWDWFFVGLQAAFTLYGTAWFILSLRRWNRYKRAEAFLNKQISAATFASTNNEELLL